MPHKFDRGTRGDLGHQVQCIASDSTVFGRGSIGELHDDATHDQQVPVRASAVYGGGAGSVKRAQGSGHGAGAARPPGVVVGGHLGVGRDGWGGGGGDQRHPAEDCPQVVQRPEQGVMALVEVRPFVREDGGELVPAQRVERTPRDHDARAACGEAVDRTVRAGHHPDTGSVQVSLFGRGRQGVRMRPEVAAGAHATHGRAGYQRHGQGERDEQHREHGQVGGPQRCLGREGVGRSQAPLTGRTDLAGQSRSGKDPREEGVQGEEGDRSYGR